MDATWTASQAGDRGTVSSRTSSMAPSMKSELAATAPAGQTSQSAPRKKCSVEVSSPPGTAMVPVGVPSIPDAPHVTHPATGLRWKPLVDRRYARGMAKDYSTAYQQAKPENQAGIAQSARDAQIGGVVQTLAQLIKQYGGNFADDKLRFGIMMYLKKGLTPGNITEAQAAIGYLHSQAGAEHTRAMLKAAGIGLANKDGSVTLGNKTW